MITMILLKEDCRYQLLSKDDFRFEKVVLYLIKRTQVYIADRDGIARYFGSEK